MALNWIKWVKGLSRRREVFAIGRALHLDTRVVAAACMETWEWADDNTTTGHIAGATIEDIDRITGITGFGSELCTAGWLDVRNDGIQFPLWERHNSQSAKQRAAASERQSRKRHGKVTKKSRSCHTSVTQKSDASSLISSSGLPEEVFPPTAEMVKGYCDENDKNVDPQVFIDFYQSKGWVVGKTKMKDWRASVRTWHAKSQPKKQKLATDDDKKTFNPNQIN